MALQTPTVLLDEAISSTTTATTSGSASPSANARLYLFVGLDLDSDSMSTTPTVTAGFTIESGWDVVESEQMRDGANGCIVYTATTGASPGSGTIQIDAQGADSWGGQALIQLIEVTDDGGSVPTDVQSAKAYDGTLGTTVTVSYANAWAAGSTGLAFGLARGNRTWTHDTGWTELTDRVSGGCPDCVMGTAGHNNSEDSSVTLTLSSQVEGNRAAIAVEVGEPAGGGLTESRLRTTYQNDIA